MIVAITPRIEKVFADGDPWQAYTFESAMVLSGGKATGASHSRLNLGPVRRRSACLAPMNRMIYSFIVARSAP